MRTAIDRMMRGGYGHRERWRGYHESGRSCAVSLVQREMSLKGGCDSNEK